MTRTDLHRCYSPISFTVIRNDDKIAKSRDLDARFQEVYAFLHNELDTADVEEIADRVMWDNNSDIEDFADILSPRLGSDISGAYSWELQRLRGRVAACLGFDAIEMNDEHGTSYLIVNPQIKGE
ncbi:AcrIF11 family anti-CRISPR ADP-ribosyltransferase [Escherichia coli]